MIKLAFAGKKGSGKTLLADYCADVHMLEPLSFADPLKMDLVELGINPDRLFTTRDHNSRALMQAYGEAMRDQDKDYWLNRLLDVMHDYETVDADGVTIDDLRYPNEATALKAKGFKLIQIIRDGYEYEPDDHPSENSLNDYTFDYVLVAKNGDKEALYRMIDEIIEELE